MTDMNVVVWIIHIHTNKLLSTMIDLLTLLEYSIHAVIGNEKYYQRLQVCGGAQGLYTVENTRSFSLSADMRKKHATVFCMNYLCGELKRPTM